MMALILLVGTSLIVLGVLSRLFALGLYRRIAASSSRDALPSFLPGTPWLRVKSDRSALKFIVIATYAAVIGGMVLFFAGLLAFDSFTQ
jgi:hypothetical protein